MTNNSCNDCGNKFVGKLMGSAYKSLCPTKFVKTFLRCKLTIVDPFLLPYAKCYNHGSRVLRFGVEAWALGPSTRHLIQDCKT